MPTTPGRTRTTVLVALIVLGAAGAWAWGARSGADPGAGGPTFVGSAACAACHQREASAWRGSHHHLAMQEPGPDTVLGDFDGARFVEHGVETTFRRDGGRWVIHTQGPDGQSRDYPVRYTFGVAPLQQYLLDIGGGRLQAFGVAWDSRPAAQGGQRWYSLYPDEALRPGDELHWTGAQQNWNHMCSECHSTDVLRNHDGATDRFATSFSEVHVGCEACHGAGSAHVDWANGRRPDGEGIDDRGLLVRFDERRGVVFVAGADGLPRRSQPRATSKELDTCARCHSRRSLVVEDPRPGRSLLQTHLPALLTDGMYSCNGIMDGEVFDHGSFLQSRMHAAGVTCSDCHDPHSGKTRLPGNELCAQCHDRARYDQPSHHRHASGGPGAACTACHMPARTYMGVDVRHDHGFSVPRPDLSIRFDVPNACTDCHRDRDASWAAAALRGWLGRDPQRGPTWTEALHRARNGLAGADAALLVLLRNQTLPAIVRATAIAEFDEPEAVRGDLLAAMRDGEPLLRVEAARRADDLDPLPITELLPLLEDPLRLVRHAAAFALAGADDAEWSAAQRAAHTAALGEYAGSQLALGDRAESHLNLGLLAQRMGRTAQAEREYRLAITRQRDFLPAHLNLADLLRALDRDAEAERVLRDALALRPDDAHVQHALALCLVRLRRTAEAVPLLATAAAAAPQEPRFAHVLATAQADTGDPRAAIATLRGCLQRHEDHRDAALLLIDLLQDHGEPEAARTEAARFVALRPRDPVSAQLAARFRL